MSNVTFVAEWMNTVNTVNTSPLNCNSVQADRSKICMQFVKKFL